MTALVRFFLAELLKAKRTLALWLCLAAPAAVGATLFVLLLGRRSSLDWLSVQSTGMFMWSFFMLPISVTALAALMGQIEYGAGGWSYALISPQRKVATFAAKVLVTLLLVALMTTVALILVPVAGTLADLLKAGDQITGRLVPANLGAQGVKIFAASLALSVLQLWAALRFRSFVPALILGVAGTFVTVVAHASKYALAIPWALPVNAIGVDEARGSLAVTVGLTAGLVAFVLMILDLSRKEFL